MFIHSVVTRSADEVAHGENGDSRGDSTPGKGRLFKQHTNVAHNTNDKLGREEQKGLIKTRPAAAVQSHRGFRLLRRRPPLPLDSPSH